MADHLDSVNKLLVRFNKMLERTDLPDNRARITKRYMRRLQMR